MDTDTTTVQEQDNNNADEETSQDMNGETTTNNNRTTRKRVMRSSISDLDIGSERRCLNQIRKLGSEVSSSSKLWNGMSAGEFAVRYLMGYQAKRREKNMQKLQQQQQNEEHQREEM